MNLKFLIGETFHSSPSYGLVELTHLSRSEQDALAGLSADENVFGVFKPLRSASDLSYKVAYKDVALLFYFLQQPSELPACLKNNYDDEMNATLARLVIDGILEISSGGEFVSGSASQEIIFQGGSKRAHIKIPRIARLSNHAIRYALHLNGLDSQTLSGRLYFYNTDPALTETILLNDFKDVERFLGIPDNSSLKKALAKNWYYRQPNETYPWLSWHCRDRPHTDWQNNDTYKLYISPVLHSLPEAFKTSVDVLTATKAFGFKTGSNAKGLLRPDKFVAYFNSFSDLQEASIMLVSKLKALSAQGVPFTGQLDEEGLISWGVDPPRKGVMENFEGGSWRTTVTEKIAAAITQAKSETLDYESSLDFVMNKISLEGIDPVTWTPK